MPSRARCRGDHPDLLVRPPCGPRSWDKSWALLFADPAVQIRAIAELRAAGLLTQEEFERQKAKALDD